MRKIIFIFAYLVAMLFCTNSIYATTDTLRVMAYNVLDYGAYDGMLTPCQGPDNVYNGYLETIIQYANPDIISLEKMASLQTSSLQDYTGSIGFQDSILQFALNAAYPGRYNACPYTNISASTYESMLFYNQQKLGFVNITSTYTSVTYPNTEDFDTYKLYYKDPHLATTNDTTFIYVTVNHDISGSTNSAERGAQIAGEMNELQNHFTHLANMINMGDYNVRNTTEPLYQTLTNPSNANFRYYDPPFSPDATFSYPADWDDNPTLYPAYLTTSTRASASSPNSCGVGGGAKDWYDHIFLSPWIVGDSNYIAYIPHSYRTLGNDGHRLNISVNDAPTNTSVPTAVANALFQMSDKYPVMVDLLVTPDSAGVSLPNPEIFPAAVVNPALAHNHVTIVNPFGEQIIMYFSSGLVGQSVTFECVDMLGRQRIQQSIQVDHEMVQIPCDLEPGVYSVRIFNNSALISQAMVTKY